MTLTNWQWHKAGIRGHLPRADPRSASTVTARLTHGQAHEDGTYTVRDTNGAVWYLHGVYGGSGGVHARQMAMFCKRFK